MENKFYSTSDCAKAVGVQEHQVLYAHRTGKIAEPELKVAGKRIYQQHEVDAIKAFFEQKKQK
jgi:hypothetical protein